MTTRTMIVNHGATGESIEELREHGEVSSPLLNDLTNESLPGTEFVVGESS